MLGKQNSAARSPVDHFPALEQVPMPADAVEVAYIGDAFGIKGGFKVCPHSGDPEAIFSSKRWFLKRKANQPGVVGSVHLLRVGSAKEHGDAVVATSADVPDRNAAEALKGCSIWVPRTSFPTLDADEFYWVDLIGCEVFNREGLRLGEVTELLSTGPQAVLVVRDSTSEPAAEHLIPFVAAYVDTVDTAAKRIVADWQPDY
jgi:16S rRNA processing protein RimM